MLSSAPACLLGPLLSESYLLPPFTRPEYLQLESHLLPYFTRACTIKRVLLTPALYLRFIEIPHFYPPACPTQVQETQCTLVHLLSRDP